MKAGSVILFVSVWVIVVALLMAFSDHRPNLNSDGGYEPCREVGHPLYTDC